MQRFSPAIKAFERLQASDGLLITADHWQRTQDYHRQRQNVYYQSLYQAGIVRGLGVTVTAAPADIEARYRNGRWITIQPGIAIDAQGNPIVVTEPFVFQVQSLLAEGGLKTVYIVLNYVDPDELRCPPGQDWVQETFRVVEKTTLDVLDIELCRIHLSAGAETLTIAKNVFFPEPNSLDLNHRCSICSRAEGEVSVAQLINPAAPNAEASKGLTHLLKAVNVLYPALRGEPPIAAVPLDTPGGSGLGDRDLLYLPYALLSHLSVTVQSMLKDFVRAGGTVLIALDEEDARQEELASIRRELLEALTDTENDPSLAVATGSVRAEIAAIEAEMAQFVEALRQSMLPLAKQLALSLPGDGAISIDHPLRTTPFLFGGWPVVAGHPIQLFCWGSILLLVGPLPQIWGPDSTRVRSRETIRTAHEMGINLLHYAWRRRQLIQLQTGSPPPIPPPISVRQQDALTGQVTS
ncbi:MAG: hypothetical protein F6J95_026950 [Leptolyngbya sp. SIO1E4]|nr:hypothetical protein [Leptolyngbya sp. SIO1E4]